MSRFDPQNPLSPAFSGEITEILETYLAKLQGLEIAPDAVAEVKSAIVPFLPLGKRFRPACLYWGYASITTDNPSSKLLAAAASLDLYHLGILIHDDLIDNSATRRGIPTIEKYFAKLSDYEKHGSNSAIIIGDLVQSWAIDLWLDSALGFNNFPQANIYHQLMRSEVNLGQYLDIKAELLQPMEISGTQILKIAKKIVDAKTGKYTTIRPLEIGASLAGAQTAQLQALAEFGKYLGRAFQYRDDLLGVFGSPQKTGKPAGDDIREGKLTALIGYAFQDSPQTKRELCQYLGKELDEIQLAKAKEIILDSGACDKLEQLITKNYEAALTALDISRFNETGIVALHKIAELAVARKL